MDSTMDGLFGDIALLLKNSLDGIWSDEKLLGFKPPSMGLESACLTFNGSGDSAGRTRFSISESSLDFYKKMLQAVHTFPDISTKLCSSVVSKVLESSLLILSSLLSNSDPVDANTNTETDTVPLTSTLFTDLMGILELLNYILDLNTIKLDDLGVEDPHRLGFCSLFKSLTELILTQVHIPRPTILQLLYTSRKVLSVSKEIPPLQLQFIESILTKARSREDFFTRKGNQNVATIIRFLVEITTLLPPSEEAESLKIKWDFVIQNLNSTTDQSTMDTSALQVVSILVENYPEILAHSEDIIRQVRDSLLVPESVKEGSFILKKITSHEADSDGNFESTISFDTPGIDIVILKPLLKTKNKFLRFWTDYFELFEILDEKQGHIIQPVLQEKLKMFMLLFPRSTSKFPDIELMAAHELCQWYFTILTKMIHHDNRLIAREGFLRFLELGDLKILLNDRVLQSTLQKFLSDKIFPLIKDHIGWILPEAEEYFSCVKKFGNFVHSVHSNSCPANQDTNNTKVEDELIIVSGILKFILADGTCLSPAATFFLIQSLPYSIRLDNGTSHPESTAVVLDKYRLQECVSLISQTITQGLTTVDLFLRNRIEHTLVKILSQRSHRWRLLLRDESDGSKITDLSSDGPTTVSLTSSLLTIVGSCNKEILTKECNKDFIRSFSTAVGLNLLSAKQDTVEAISKSIIQNDSSGAQTIALIRLIWIPYLTSDQVNWEMDVFEVLKIIVRDSTCSEHLLIVLGGVSEFLKDYIQRSSEGETSNLDENMFTFQLHLTYSQLFSSVVNKLGSFETAETFDKFCEEKIWEIFQQIEFLQVLCNCCFNTEIRLGVTEVSPNSWRKLLAAITQLEKDENSSTYINKSATFLQEFIVWKLVAVTCQQIYRSGNYIEEAPIALKSIVTLFSNLAWIDSSITSNPDWKLDNDKYEEIYEDCPKTEFYQSKYDAFETSLSFLASVKWHDHSHYEPVWNKKTLLELKEWKKCISAVIDNVDKASHGGVVSAISCTLGILVFLVETPMFEELKADLEAQDLLRGFVHLAWNHVWEMKTDMFRSAMKGFVAVISHSMFEGQSEILPNYADKIFDKGETVTGLPLHLLQEIEDWFHACSCSLDNVKDQVMFDICLRASLHGSAVMKNIRVIFGLWEYLQQNEPAGATTADIDCSFQHDVQIRLKAIAIIKSVTEALKREKPEDQSWIRLLTCSVTYLLENNDNNAQKRHFGNSSTHRKMQRIIQTLLFLEPLFTKELSKVALERLVESLSVESPQPSVRYLTEWIIIRILTRNSELWDLFFTNSAQNFAKRIGFGSFFASICLHTSRSLEFIDANRSFFEQAFRHLTQLVVGHHVTVRVYSQVCFQKIFSLVKEFGWTTLTYKYQVVFDSLQSSNMKPVGNSAKILAALNNDFYLQLFCPRKHFTPEVILIYLPRLSGVSSDELPIEHDIKISKLVLSADDTQCDVLSATELKHIYRKHEQLVWHLKTIQVSGREMGEELPLVYPSSIPVAGDFNSDTNGASATTTTNFQKKINPWKTLPSSEQSMDNFSDQFLSKKRSAIEDGLIVVGSLVDRIPNLGGLCRSCEIFGVSKYIIPSLKILEDQQFQNLSVSAHNWVDIVEVPTKDLESFLITYSAKGYKIIGIEQALESTRLNDYKFPKKSLLLLGNEKYGIPTNLLHLVDTCLEIPQVGVIRSLNVHVTGALCIWEYAAQHSF